MKIKMKIRQKILLFVLSASAFLYIIAIGYISFSSRKSALEDARRNAVLTAREVAALVDKGFERDFALTRTLAQAFSIYKSMDTAQWQKLFPEMYKPVLKDNPHIYCIWDSWEFYGFVPGYDKTYGRIFNKVAQSGDSIVVETAVRSENGDPPLYASFKAKAVEHLWDPYFDRITDDQVGDVLMTTIGVPVNIDGKYMGMIGLDLELTALQKMIEGVKPVEGSYAFILANNGYIAGHANTEYINKSIGEVWEKDSIEHNINQYVQKGEEYSFVRENEDGKDHFVVLVPISPGKIKTPWSLVLSIPVDVMTAKANRDFLISLIVGIIGLIILVVVLILVADNLTKPIVKITKTLNRLSKGEVDQNMKLQIDSGDEIEEMSEALNVSIEGLNNKASFAQAIGKGNLDSSLEMLSGSDVLGKSLIDMQKSLLNASEEEQKRKLEDQKRTWSNEGFALFADLLRKNNNDIKKLGDEVIKSLVKYLDANQGGIMLANIDNENDMHFELISSYAWDRKKFLQKRIEWGEGLVGACALEQKTIFLTQVPDSYVEVTSGLGQANPTCIILVPLMHEEEILGVVELASFKVLQPYEIEFLERTAESIASTLQAVRVNAKTRVLLEQTQIHAEEMAAQEEEMRQNMEELHATQEDAARKSMEIQSLVNSLSAASYLVEYDLEGRVINVNDLYLDRIGIRRDQALGTYYYQNLDIEEEQIQELKAFWATIKAGRSRKRKSIVKVNNQPISFIETYIPVKDYDDRIMKILKLSHELDEFEE